MAQETLTIEVTDSEGTLVDSLDVLIETNEEITITAGNSS